MPVLWYLFALTNLRTEIRLDIGLHDANNVGSRSYKLIDCVPTAFTSHPSYSAALTECYWTHKIVHGWWPDNGNDGQRAYSDVLASFGF
jgi:hypothetical protein